LYHSVPDYQHRLLALKDPVGGEVLGKPVGEPVESWKIPPLPTLDPIVGHNCRVERLSMAHSKDLFEAYQLNKNGSNWTYLTYGPFNEFSEYQKFLSEIIVKPDPMFHAIIDLRTNKPVGVATFMEINPVNGSIEIGHISFSPLMQRTIMSSEAIIMMAKKAFEWGYRRLEWKCHSLNGPSVNAAKRYGFNYEGVFRSIQVMKGNNRDTAWFSITLDEWPGILEVYNTWLNLAQEGKHTSLSTMMIDHKKKCFNENQ
jgi:RimJ/RimL family protein N-acetyltransferase